MNAEMNNLTGSNHTILLAEDDPDDVFLFRRALREANFDTRLWVACDGQQAIDYLQGRAALPGVTGNSCPSLMLLDLEMPYKNGFEVLTWVREQPELKKLAVIMLSSVDRIEVINRAYDLGANSYLVKPSTFKGLVDIVESLHKYWLGSNRPAESGSPPRQATTGAGRELVAH